MPRDEGEPSSASPLGFLAGGGEMGAFMRAHDWTTTAVGLPETWPQVLKTVVRVILTSRHPMFLWWGEVLTCFYNDAYSALIGPDRHPAALGRLGREVWAEIWDVVGPQIEFVMAGRGATWHERQLVPITRGDMREDVWWTYSYSPVDDETSATGVGGVLVVCRDVTAEVRAEQTHADEAERLRRLFHQAPGFMCVLRGPAHVFEMVNAAYLRLLGHRDLLGKPAREAVPEVDGQGFFELLDEVYATGKPFVGQESPIKLQRRAGEPVEERFITFVYQPITDAEGRVSGIFVEGSDVTEAKRAGDALRDLNETLEQRVAAEVAKRADAEEQLRQAQKMEVVGQLTGGIAHDFNNLLQIVTGNLDILSRNLPEGAGRLRRSADNAMTGAKRAATLTQRLLAFARRQPLEPKPINVNALVSGMSELLGRTLGETVEIETVQAGGLWRIEADPNQLESAILNLAVNARDAMPTGGKLTIETANAHLDRGDVARDAGVTPGKYVVLCVSDTGAGMDEATRARVFEPFFTTKEVGKGTGLGLSQVYGFVKQSGGHVKLHSEQGQGTTVKIYLPRLLRAGTEEEPANEQPVPAGTGAETVLVVEDDDDVRALSVEVLRELGYRVLETHDAPSALRLLERQDGHVDLLFTDVVLPGGMTGAELVAQARALRPALKVLYTTGYARNAIVHQGRLDAGVALITKPFSYADLAARVREILDASSGIGVGA